jgi:hypothetical protein
MHDPRELNPVPACGGRARPRLAPPYTAESVEDVLGEDGPARDWTIPVFERLDDSPLATAIRLPLPSCP